MPALECTPYLPSEQLLDLSVYKPGQSSHIMKCILATQLPTKIPSYIVLGTFATVDSWIIPYNISEVTWIVDSIHIFFGEQMLMLTCTQS